jgi:hypothetical protein
MALRATAACKEGLRQRAIKSEDREGAFVGTMNVDAAGRCVGEEMETTGGAE